MGHVWGYIFQQIVKKPFFFLRVTDDDLDTYI